MKKILMSAAALLLSAVGAYAAQQKYYFLYEEGHEDQPETSWFILDREAKKYIPDSCGDDELTVKNYKKSGNTETFDCYDNSSFTLKSMKPKTEAAVRRRRRHRAILWTKPQKRLSQD